jgi:LacI family transcriptional regulator
MSDGGRPRATPTISQVAKAAGVSRSSVSRAFSNPGMLGEQTVRHILNVAAGIGYAPNHTARALSTGRYGNVALIVPDIANPFFPPLIQAAQAEADGSDFCVFLGNSNEDPEREDRLLARFSGQVEGVVLVSSRLSEERIRGHAARRPLVLVNRDIKGIPRVLIDSGPGVVEGVAHLHALGHRAIAYVSGPRQSWSSRQRQRAVTREGGRLGMDVPVVTTPAPLHQAGREAAPRILASGATAVVAFDDLMAQGIIWGLSERGVAVPGQVSVIGCDDVLDAATFPALTTVSSRSVDAGKSALAILLDHLRQGTASDIRSSLDTHLVVRGTTAPPGPPAVRR